MSLPVYSEDPISQEKLVVSKKTTNIKQIIGVHSGKGGVGKTTIAVQIALLLASENKKVGLLDADIDCPNIPEIIPYDKGIEYVGGKLKPVVHKKIKVMSAGYISEEKPLILRGPIKHRVLIDLLTKTKWDELDYLIVDLPPGTSDVPLSAMQVINLNGLFIVSTPSKIALKDAQRAIMMADQFGVRIIGLIENMSGDVFGVGKVKELALRTNKKFVCSIPLSEEIRLKSEKGDLAISTYKQQIINCI